jgi:hypothetical protein
MVYNRSERYFRRENYKTYQFFEYFLRTKVYYIWQLLKILAKDLHIRVEW